MSHELEFSWEGEPWYLFLPHVFYIGYLPGLQSRMSGCPIGRCSDIRVHTNVSLALLSAPTEEAAGLQLSPQPLVPDNTR